MAREKMTRTKIDSIYWYKAGKVKKYAYRYKYYDKFGKRREKTKQGFDTIEQAERALIEVKAAVLDGQEELVLNQNLKLNQWLDYWYAQMEKRWEVTTAASKKISIDTHLIPVLGDIALPKLTNLTVQRLVDKMHDDGLAITTVKKVVNVLRQALHAAVDENIIKQMPFAKLDYSQLKENPKRESLQMDGLDKVYECIYKEHITRKAALVTLLTTGMRAGEFSAIRFKDVDLENRTININETRSHLKENGGLTKTKNSVRTIRISETLYDVLVEYKKWLFATLGNSNKKITDDTFFFYSSTGKPVHSTYGSYVVKHFAKKYKIKNLTAHIFRHTYASILIAEQVPVTTVAQLIGDTAETVISTYAHSIKEQEQIAVSVFDKILTQKKEENEKNT